MPLLAEKQCQSVDRLEGEEKKLVINMCPKCVCFGKSLMVNFLTSSKKKQTYKIASIMHFVYETVRKIVIAESLFVICFYIDILPHQKRTQSLSFKARIMFT